MAYGMELINNLSAILEEDEVTFSVKPDQDLQSFLQESSIMSLNQSLQSQVVSPTFELFPPTSALPNDVFPQDDSLLINLSEGSKMHISSSIINCIHTRVFHDLRTVCKRVTTFIIAEYINNIG